MKKCLFAGLGALALCALIAGVWLSRVLASLPDVSTLKNYRPPTAAEVLDKDGGFLTNYYDQKLRIWAPISGLPAIVIKAVVTAEDDTFFEHHGVNYEMTREALLHDLQKRRFARGGSTITQQMIKNVFLSKEKTITRKLREYVLARKAEEILSKRRILEIYLNEVEWGEDIHGIEAAVRFYLDKHASEVTIAEAALLAGMLPNPRYYDPFKRPDKARKRQERVLFNMQQAKIITPEEYAAALQEPLQLRKEFPGRTGLSAPTARTAARPCYHHALEEMLATVVGDQKLYRSGGIIRTTLDKALQNELGAWEASQPDHVNKPTGPVLVVTQAGRIRALVCDANREADVKSKLGVLGMAWSGYEVSTLAPRSVSSGQIVLSIDKGQK